MKYNTFKDPKCFDSRPCFAKSERGNCTILTVGYKDKLCPFCKPHQFKDKDGNEYPPEVKKKMREFA